MRKLVTTIATAAVLSLSALPASNAAPVPGFEALYAALVTACSLPAGAVPDCEAAINAYSGAIVGAVDLTVANQSFTEVRAEVFATNAPNEEFQADIDALFELLLPDSGAVGGTPSPVVPG